MPPALPKLRRGSQPDPVLDEIRWFFENSSTSLSRLSRLYNVARTTLQYRIRTEQWRRYAVPADPEQRARDLLAVQAMAAGRQAQGSTMPASSASVRTRVTDDSAGADRGIPPYPVASIASPKPVLPNSAGPSAGQVIAFPGPGTAQETNPTTCTDTVGAPLRVRMRTGALRQRDADPIAEFQALVSDYIHLLRVYLRPDQHAEIDGLEPAEAEAAAMQLHAMARAILLPTARDSLAGAMKVGAACIANLTDLMRAPVGANGPPMIGTGTRSGGGLSDTLPKLSVAELRMVQAAMELLKGNETRASEPPMPPPPEPLKW